MKPNHFKDTQISLIFYEAVITFCDKFDCVSFRVVIHNLINLLFGTEPYDKQIRSLFCVVYNCIIRS